MATRESFTSGDVLLASELNNMAVSMIALNAQTGTTYTFVLSDDGKLCTFDNASPITATIPANSSVAYGI